MLNEDKHQPIYRFNRYNRRGDRPKKYRSTVEVLEHADGCVLASCDVVGDPVFALQTAEDEQGDPWRMKPNRRIMPSRWAVIEPQGRTVLQFDQKIGKKMLNPLTRVMLTLLDADGNERYRLVDPESNLLDQVMGSSPLKWAVVEGKVPVAKLVHIPREEVTQNGIRGWLKRIRTGSDRCLVSLGDNHLLPAPAALFMVILFDALSANTAE